MPARTPRLALALCLAPLLLAPTLAGEQRVPPKPEFSESITADEVLARTAYLASDELAGRTGGTDGGRMTEEYVAREFERFGLEFLGEGEGLAAAFQEVKLPFRVPILERSWVAFERAEGDVTRIDTEKSPLPFGFSADTEATGELVFVGYGLRSKEVPEFDEYAGVDVKGKIVLVLRHGPNEHVPESPWHLNMKNYRKSGRARGELGFARKVQWAAKAGAAGVLFVNDRHHADDALPAGGRGPKSPIPVMAISQATARTLLAPLGKTHTELQEAIDAETKPASMAVPGTRVTLHPGFGGATARNVIAIRRGTDPVLSSEAVIVGAHLDHIGYGWFGALDGGGALHNGADDNASGTAAMLEIAEAIAAGPAPRRTIIFAGWCGEEMGLAGSKLYVNEPYWPLADTVACVNLDMVGRYDAAKKREPGLSSLGAPTGSGFKEKVERLAKGHDLEMHHSWSVWQQSDHFSFYRKNIPSLFLTTGLHPDYHRAGDKWWKIESDAQARIAEMTAALVREVADAAERPAFTPKPQRPVLGVRMADADDGSGALLVQVLPKFGAGKAGLVANDKIVAVDGKPVKTSGEVGALVQKHKPGEKVAITYVRGEAEPVTVDVELAGR